MPEMAPPSAHVYKADAVDLRGVEFEDGGSRPSNSDTLASRRYVGQRLTRDF